MGKLRERFEQWAIANNKPYDRMTPWAACEAAFAAGYKAALEAAARDAERYRFLRMNPTQLGWDADYRPDEVDAAIDRAKADSAPAPACPTPAP